MSRKLVLPLKIPPKIPHNYPHMTIFLYSFELMTTILTPPSAAAPAPWQHLLAGSSTVPPTTPPAAMPTAHPIRPCLCDRPSSTAGLASPGLRLEAPAARGAALRTGRPEAGQNGRGTHGKHGRHWLGCCQRRVQHNKRPEVVAWFYQCDNAGARQRGSAAARQRGSAAATHRRPAADGAAANPAAFPLLAPHLNRLLCVVLPRKAAVVVPNVQQLQGHVPLLVGAEVDERVCRRAGRRGERAACGEAGDDTLLHTLSSLHLLLPLLPMPAADVRA